VPTLIIHGDADTMADVATSRKLAERLAHAQLQIIPGADHFMIVSHAEIIKAMIGDFLEDARLNR
jgi:pimeloyl-ACP methyl ester carboxylesterase